MIWLITHYNERHQMTAKKKMIVARKLINDKQFYRARRILDTIDNSIFRPTARKWMRKIDVINSQALKEKSFPHRFGKSAKLFLLVAGIIIIVIFSIGEYIKGQQIRERIEQIQQSFDVERHTYCAIRYSTYSNAWERCIDNN